MKALFLLFIISFINHSYAQSIRGKLSASQKCQSQTNMVWLGIPHEDYQKRVLLMHTELPINGTFEFYVKPGVYEVRATNNLGCGFLKIVTVENQVLNLSMQLEDN